VQSSQKIKQIYSFLNIISNNPLVRLGTGYSLLEKRAEDSQKAQQQGAEVQPAEQEVIAISDESPHITQIKI